jgi:5'-methylthioadenosine phosphorylase
MFKMLGGDLVGMTMVPEVVLAREKGICYLHLSVVTNMAAGTRLEKISHDDVERVIANNTVSVRKLIKRVIENERITGKKCRCGTTE